ncbi:ABC transporter permease [Flavobacterium sp. CS20]|uniref:ABC transporter permease n=1 Tax=Flavobacterium sp. CS20 TaxID=2775246 RepID=UPI001B39F2FD|nr:ABC transporter permease [Flavobacterium sp. CS20]QTY26192.1 ABC transporter permease [Flavobacterium sp. CS20]
MLSLERWLEVFEAISKNKLRTFLTGFSVATGILILVLLLGIGEGMKNGVEEQFQRDATNQISVYTGVTGVEYKGLNPGRRIQFKNNDYDLLVKNFGDELEYKSSVYRIWIGLTSYKDKSGSYRIEGVLPDYQFLENAEIIQGRFINHKDQSTSTKEVVIGKKVRDELFEDKNPLGKLIEIKDINFKVVGVFQDPGGDREESRVYMAISTMQKVFGAGQDIRNMSFTMPKEKSFDVALEKSNQLISQLEAILKAKHTVSPLDNSAINISNSIETSKRIYELTANIKLFFWLIGLASLLAGIIGVSNIMLIIVKERTKEIGIRKALGAKPISIVGMVLHESIFVTAVSGFMGLIVGLVLLEFVGPMINTEFISNPEVSFNIAISTVIVLVLAGAIAGFFPAWRGAKIKPINALREE